MTAYVDPDEVMNAARTRAEEQERNRRVRCVHAARHVGLNIPHDAWIKAPHIGISGYHGYVAYYVHAGVGDWVILCDDPRWEWGTRYRSDSTQPIRLQRGRPQAHGGTRVANLADIGQVMFPASTALASAPEPHGPDPTFNQLLQAAREEIARFDGIDLPAPTVPPVPRHVVIAATLIVLLVVTFAAALGVAL